MSRAPAEHVILAEDRQQEVFARRLLRELGVEPRKMRFNTAPPGSGSGEQYVREQYPSQLRACRSHLRVVSPRLIVLIDADTGTVDDRHRQLAQQLDAQGLAPRSPGDRLALLVPRRNIETWIAHLTGTGPVDEALSYPRLPREGDCQPAVLRLAPLVRHPDPLPDDCPDSLRRAILELRAILG